MSEDEFRPLRLRNGLYVQRHAPMLRIAIPYGVLSAKQLRTLATSRAATTAATDTSPRVRTFSSTGFGSRTRPISSKSWPAVEMHAIQTSGNSVRNITSDEFAGVAADELIDPRAFCEILRQWSSFHPEFTWLPRKFKIAINGAREDRAAVAFHDIGLHLTRAPDGALGFRVLVGGGMGRTPIIGTVIREFLPWQQYLTYIESILRVYNRHGRRDNIHKARIKILVRTLGIEEFARQVEEDFAPFADGPSTVTDEELHRVASYFAAAAVREARRACARHFGARLPRWVERSVKPHVCRAIARSCCL